MNPSLLYVVGAGHSGSSLLDVLLGSIDGTVGTGELNRLSLSPGTRECSCGTTLDQCTRWESVARALDLESHASLVSAISARHPDGALMSRTQQMRAIQRPTSRLHSVEPRYMDATRAAWAVIDALSNIEQRSTVIDSTKTAARAALLAQVRPGTVFVVHLVRDPRAVVASAIRRTGTPVRPAAVDWIHRNVVARQVALRQPVAGGTTVWYEELCRHPLATVQRVATAAGLPPPDRLALPLSPTDSHRIPGNPILSRTIDSIHSDERWREQLSHTQQRLVTAITGPYEHWLRMATRPRQP